MKKFLIVALILTFVCCFVFSAYAANVSGIITKIDCNKITIKQADGKEVTVELKVGDKITIKQDGKEKGKEAAPKKKKAVEGC